MNERIRELEKQAMFIFLNGNDPDRDVDKMYIPSEFTNKFAELIVEECANVADENYIHRGSRTCGLAIRLHFGVEE